MDPEPPTPHPSHAPRPLGKRGPQHHLDSEQNHVTPRTLKTPPASSTPTGPQRRTLQVKTDRKQTRGRQTLDYLDSPMSRRNYTPHLFPSSTLDFLLSRPHTRLLNSKTILYPPFMTIRTADEADLPNDRDDKDAVRPRIDTLPNGTTTVANTSGTTYTFPAVPNTRPTTIVNNPTIAASNTTATTAGNLPPIASPPAPPEDADALMKALDILSYVDLPTPDPLHVHGWDTAKALENVSPAQLPLWVNAHGAKVFLYKAYGGRVEGKNDILPIRDMVKDFLQMTANPIIAAPSSGGANKNKEDPPLCALVQGISHEQAESLVKKVSTPHHTTRTNH